MCVYTVCFVCHFRLGATATVLRKREVIQANPEQRWVAEVLVRKVPDDQQVRVNIVIETPVVN